MQRTDTVLRKILPILIIVIVFGGAFWKHEAILSLVGKGSEERSELLARGVVPVKVIVQPVEITSNDRAFRAVGTGRAWRSIEIYPSVIEEVTDIFFKAQQQVKKGDVLAQLDNREEALAVKLAEVQLKDAQSLLARYEVALKEGGVPESEVDAARADFESAKVALDQAKLSLDERQIKAPFDGIVGIPNVDPGDRVGTDTLISGLDARDTLYVDFEVPEALAGALKAAEDQQQEITATTPAYPSMDFKGHISAQESRVDPDRRTLLARASIDNSRDLLRPGMSFETLWEIPGEEYATVPEISVQWDRNGSYIWIIKDNIAKKTPVMVVTRKAGRVLLDGEIQDGDFVVIEGLQRLRPDRQVEVVGASAQ